MGWLGRFAAAVLFMVLFCCLLLALAEGAVRWHYRAVLSTPDGQSYFSWHSTRRFRAEYNAFKLRGAPFRQGADERYRIVVQGDSFTYGQGVYPAAKRFTEKVGTFFQSQAPGLPVEVVNVGVCGFNLGEHVRFAPFVSNIHPDYVLYQWYINDVEVRQSDGNRQVMTPALIANAKIHSFLVRHSALYYLLQNRYGALRILLGKQRAYEDYLVDRFSDPQAAPAALAQRKLKEYISYFKARNIPLGIVLFPSFSHDIAKDLSGYRLDFLHDRTLEVCREEGIDCLDLRATYAGIKHNTLWANVFDSHPGEMAHDLAAKAIFAHYYPLWRQQAEAKERRLAGDKPSGQETKHE